MGSRSSREQDNSSSESADNQMADNNNPSTTAAADASEAVQISDLPDVTVANPTSDQEQSRSPESYGVSDEDWIAVDDDVLANEIQEDNNDNVSEIKSPAASGAPEILNDQNPLEESDLSDTEADESEAIVSNESVSMDVGGDVQIEDSRETGDKSGQKRKAEVDEEGDGSQSPKRADIEEDIVLEEDSMHDENNVVED